MISPIRIGSRTVGPDAPVYVIAEMSANHGQDLAQARELVRAAKECGADAIKLQTYTADTLTLDCDAPPFLIGPGSLWEGRRLHELYREAFTPWEWQPVLKAEAEALGLDCFSSPFDETAVDFLEAMNVPAYKVASFELIDLPLIRRVAATGKPLILSTGMASFAEIAEAVRAFRTAGGRELALLKCTSAYPSPPEAMNLRTIVHLAESFAVPVGLSDHTRGVAAPVAAVSLGACIIEKHLTLARAAGGPDSAFSLEPGEFRAMADAVREATLALGSVSYEVTPAEEPSLRFRRSLFAVADIAAGDLLTKENVRSIRPADGLPPKFMPDLLGRRARHAMVRGTPLTWKSVD